LDCGGLTPLSFRRLDGGNPSGINPAFGGTGTKAQSSLRTPNFDCGSLLPLVGPYNFLIAWAGIACRLSM